ncbi:hypothetical protein [Prosthecobacter sp.]|uniref:hypothetical protein n=1 Tax=Prosthecobacter sp. TaxID=1965333 RepID=UPI002AB8B1C4|nr:hypothetical protein [Prosthecobacter sp.]MDZ4404887.1 hypothetical protein [Prosthecobacter sp.]
MQRKPYYPRKVAEQPNWHFTYAEQLVLHGVSIGLVLADVTASVNDSKHLGYGLGAWLNSVREFGPGSTGQVEVLKYGTGTTPFTLPEFTAPTPPAGLTAVLPGALARIFRYVRAIKAAPGYTEGIGLLMGIVGEELPPPPPGSGVPRLTLALNQIPAQQQVLLKFFKDGHEGIWIESRRNGGAWEFLAISSKSPYTDTRALLVASQAEVREYRAMFWDAGQPNGEWCDVAKITVSP